MPPKFYGIAEIAAELGERRETVAQWHNRGKLPAPDEVLRMGPVWSARRIQGWIRAQRGLNAEPGRLRQEKAPPLPASGPGRSGVGVDRGPGQNGPTHVTVRDGPRP